MSNDLVKPEQFSVVKVDAQVSMDDVLDSKVWEYEKKLMSLTEEVGKDNVALKKQILDLQNLLEKSYKNTDFAELKAKARKVLVAIVKFTERDMKEFDIESRGEFIESETRPAAVKQMVTVITKDGHRYVSKSRMRELTPAEVKWTQDIKRISEDICVNNQYLAQLEKAGAKVPLIRRELKNRVVRQKLEAAGQTKLLDSIDSFEIPIMPKQVRAKK
jgi:hypothetical protein